jgi:hypothetical protein
MARVKGTDASTESLHPALARLLQDSDVAEAFALLTERVSGADLTTLLMAVVRDRAGALSANDVFGQYVHDRFVRPATVDVRRLRAVEEVAIDEAGALFEFVIESPLAPAGAHSVIAGVNQNNVVTTIRSTEVAADPTNTLALEAAVRRRELLEDDPRSTVPVRLAAIQRVIRAQRFDGPLAFAHFELLGMVTAGRDVGNHSFEVEAIVEHIRTMSAIVRRAGVPRVRALLSDLDGRFGPAVDGVVDALDQDDVETIVWPQREAGRGYYPDLCFKLLALIDNDGNDDAAVVEIGDGGMVPWTQALLQNRKERLMISGLGLERLASLVGE